MSVTITIIEVAKELNQEQELEFEQEQICQDAILNLQVLALYH